MKWLKYTIYWQKCSKNVYTNSLKHFMSPFVSLSVRNLRVLLWNIICLCLRKFSLRPKCP